MIPLLRRRTYRELVEAELSQARLDLLEAARNFEDARALLSARRERINRLEGELSSWTHKTPSTNSSPERPGFSPTAEDTYIATPLTPPPTLYARE